MERFTKVAFGVGSLFMSVSFSAGCGETSMAGKNQATSQTSKPNYNAELLQKYGVAADKSAPIGLWSNDSMHSVDGSFHISLYMRNVSRNLRQFSHLFNITNFPLVPPIRGADTAPR